MAAAIREVADHLGNTPAVARASYVDPRLIEQFGQGRTVLPALRRLSRLNGATPSSADLSDDDVRAAVETAVTLASSPTKSTHMRRRAAEARCSDAMGLAHFQREPTGV